MIEKQIIVQIHNLKNQIFYFQQYSFLVWWILYNHLLIKLDIFTFISVDIPPISSWTNLFVFVSAYIEPSNNSRENISMLLRFNEKISSSINATIIWIINKENNDLNQEVNKKVLFLLINEMIQNGDRRISNFINIYLKEYEKTKFNKPIEINALINPSIENRFKLELT